MKLLIIIIHLIVLIVVSKKLKKNKQIPSIMEIVTPKGNEKREKKQEASDFRELKIIDKDGVEHREYISNKLYDDSNFKKECRIDENAYYQFCSMINDCAMCASSKYCGWCGKSKKCMPGNIEHAQCPDDCLQNWIFDVMNVNMCNVKIDDFVYNSGRLDNVQKNHNITMIKALITSPKYKVRSFETEFKPVSVEYPVGNLESKEQYYFTDLKGQFNTRAKLTNKKLTKKIKINMPVKSTVIDHYYDADTNDLLNPKQSNVHHGV